MEKQLPKRKGLPHFPGIDRINRPTIHLVTVCTKDRRRLLDCDAMHQILRSAWGKADSFMVGRYVLMPDHLHLFCMPVQTGSDYLVTWIRYWKSMTTRQHPNLEKGRLWQRDFWDTQMRTAENYATKWDYIWLNPVRSGLVSNPDDWPYKGEMHPCRWEN